MVKMKYSLFAALLLFSHFFIAQNQPVLEANRDSILIGEQIELTLSIPYDITQVKEIQWPKMDSIIGQKLEVLKVSAADTLMADQDGDQNIFVQSKTILITSFDSGFFAIPPFDFRVNSLSKKTEPLLITVVAPKVDILNDFKDVKPIIPIEMTFWDYWQAYKSTVYVVLGLIVLAWLLNKYWKKSQENNSEEEVPEEEKIPPYVLAITQLNRLKSKDLYKQGMVKEHYVELTDILRNYIENRYDINATDETTDQILQELRSINVHKKDRSKLSKILQLADFVKFAKAKPSVMETEIALQNSYEFLEKTKPIEEEVSDD